MEMTYNGPMKTFSSKSSIAKSELQKDISSFKRALDLYTHIIENYSDFDNNVIELDIGIDYGEGHVYRDVPVLGITLTKKCVTIRYIATGLHCERTENPTFDFKYFDLGASLSQIWFEVKRYI